MTIQTTDQRIAELLNLRRKIDAELARLAAIEREAERTKRARDAIPDCGTESAWQRHHHAGEPIDEACRRAHNAHNREQYALRAAVRRAA
jgi:hypothetical protein